jgi:hypothetical protein
MGYMICFKISVLRNMVFMLVLMIKISITSIIIFGQISWVKELLLNINNILEFNYIFV